MAVDFLSRLELKVTEKIRLKIGDTHTTPIEVKIFSSDVADEENFLFTQSDTETQSKEQTLQQRRQFQQDAKQWVADEPSFLETSVTE